MTGDSSTGFVDFYRRYAKTWVHALATAALTAFGLLTVVHDLFVGAALAAYALPPLVLYFTGASVTTHPRGDTDHTNRTDHTDRTDRTADPSLSDGSPSATTSDGHGSDPAGDGRQPSTRDRRSRTTADGPSSGADAADPAEAHWTLAETPTDETLYDVVVGSESYAVGSGGTVLAETGDGWRVAVADGPGAAGNTLRGVAAVPDGGVWFAGDGGAVGRLDPSSGRVVDHSAPDGDTSTVTDVAASLGDDETVLLADGSGRIRRGRWRGGAVAWDEPVTPGSGSSMAGVAFVDGSVGYACDTDDGVFRTTDGGASFARLDAVGASGTVTDVAVSGADTCLLTADDGVLHRHDGTTWTPTRLGDDPLAAVAVGGRGLGGVVVGADGTLYERAATTPDWTRVLTPTDGSLRGVSLGRDGATAVGTEGILLERSPDPR